MTTMKYPDGFPLKPEDAEGNVLRTGDTVRILHIPDRLLEGLDEDAVQALKGCSGELMVIQEIDDYGYMWVEKPVLKTDNAYVSHSFSLEPKYLLKS